MRHSKNSMSFICWSKRTSVIAGLPLLLVPSLAIAQNAPVTPADNAVAGPPAAAAVPAPAPIAALAGQPRIDIALNDVPVAKALEMIAEYGEIDIIIGTDIDNSLVLRRISLRGVPPEEAIQKVARAASLQWARTGNKEYLVAKNLPAANTLITPAGNSGSGTTNANNNNTGAITNAITGAVVPSPDRTLSAVPDGTIPNLGNLAGELPPLPTLSAGYEDTDKTRVGAHYIPVRNVRPGMMAWWIDPGHHPMPLENQMAQKSTIDAMRSYPARPVSDPAATGVLRGTITVPGVSLNNPYADNGDTAGAYGQFRGNAQFGTGRNTNRNNNRNNTTGNRTGGDVFELPEGVDRVIAVDSQNVLLVYGTEEGVRELEGLIAYLDRPVQQVEIEAQFVSVTNTDARSFGIDFNSSNGPFTARSSGISSGSGTFSLGFVKGNFQATLNALITNRRAKAIQSPRVTTLNNLSATVQFETNTPFILTTTQSGLSGDVAQGQDAFFLTTSIGLTVTPTINADGTITVLMLPQVQIQDPPTAGGIPGFTSQFVQTVANVADGDTIALGGLRTRQVTREKRKVPLLSNLPIIGRLFEGVDNSSIDTDLIIFLTARVVRRSVDAGGVAGT